MCSEEQTQGQSVPLRQAEPAHESCSPNSRHIACPQKPREREKVTVKGIVV